MRISLAIVVLALLAACAVTPRVFGPGDDQAVRAVLDKQRNAWNLGDLEGFMAGYDHTDDLVFTSGGNIRRGWQETFEKYRAKYGTAPATMGHLTFKILAVQALGADGAIVLGRWQLQRSFSEAKIAAGGIFSVALRRTDAGWRIVHDHTSADAPPPEPPTQ